MPATGSTLALDYGSLDDPALVALVQSGDRSAFREIIQRCNQRLFRVARGVLNDDAEAEDVVQAAYVDAYARLGEFRGESALLTWLTRIVLNEAYGRLRQRRPTAPVEAIEMAQLDGGRVVPFPLRYGNEDPAAGAARAQIRGLIEHAVDALARKLGKDPVAHDGVFRRARCVRPLLFQQCRERRERVLFGERGPCRARWRDQLRLPQMQQQRRDCDGERKSCNDSEPAPLHRASPEGAMLIGFTLRLGETGRRRKRPGRIDHEHHQRLQVRRAGARNLHRRIGPMAGRSLVRRYTHHAMRRPAARFAG